MTVHVLHAGDGYSYLTNQVAAGDQQVRRSEELTDYYTAEGAKPGQWWGNGLASLGVSGQVSTEQMQALFGEGLRPDATAFIQEQIAAGASASEAIDAARLGRRFMTTNDPDTEWQAQVHAASVAFEREHQRAPQDAELAGIKTDVAATMLQKSLRRPATSDEVSWFVALRVPDWKQQVSRGYQAFRDEVGRSPETGPERDLVKHNLAADHLRTSLGRDATTGEIARFLTERGAPARQPVAGYDLVFSPVKSVSVLWALADRNDPREAHIAREVHAAHEAAWQGAMTWFEQEAAYTRTGAGGVAQMKTNGLLVAAFEHRDSRTGDPDLHTHVAVSTKVQGVDGKWRSADGRMFHNLGVAASERYNSLVEQELRNRLGLQFVEETRGQDKRGVREVMGVDKGMRDGFSSRRVGIEQAYSELVDEYVAAHGHTPPKNIQHKLYEQANLATREGKAPPSSEETQVAEWRQAAREHVQVDGWAADVVAQSRAMPAQDSLATASVEQLGALVVARVEQDRSTWKDSHLQAEADRLARRVAQVTGQDVQALADDVTMASLRRSVSLAPPELNPVPAQLRHDTGESVFRVHRSEQYTSEKTLRTEEAVLTAARTRGGFAMSRADFDAAIERFNARAVADGDHELNTSQLNLARRFATGGHRIETGIGPAGAGKTTAMRATIYAVEAGGGHVLALGTTGKAAQVLGRELGTDADTAHMLIQAHATAKRTGQPVAERYRIDQNTVLLLDEASMAGNPEFGRLLALADEHGAALRPLGDPAQHGSIGAGGILRLLDRETDVARLTEVHRFTGEHGQDEAAASLKVRAGDATGLDFYIEHGRVFAGTRDEVMDRIYTDWKRDTDAGKSSLMMAGTNEEVSALNARARADRVDAGAVEASGRLLADGNTVGVGDTILTRSTERSLRVNQGKDWVTNQDMWTVTAVSPYGVMAKHHVHGGTVTLPLDYVSEHVQLGYAHTDYGVQGDTVTTGGVVVDPATTTREGLYVPLTRGKDENRLYVVIDKPLDGGHTDDERENSVRGALEQVLAREGATKSATEVMRTEQDTALSLTTLLPQYDHGRVTVLDPKALERAEQAVRDALPADLASRIVADEAWSTFAARLVDHDLAGTALQDRLQGLVRPRDLDTLSPIESPARVYWFRLGPATTIGTDLAPVEGLPKWVTPFNDQIGDPEVRTWLHGQQEIMRDRITSLVDQVVAEPPAWAEPFGRVPADPAQAEQWRENMGRIVAYREAFEVPASEAVLSEEPRGAHAVQAWQDARAAGLDLRTQQDRLDREQAAAAALERMGIDPTARTATTSTATMAETAVVVDVDRLLEQKPAWLAQYGTQPADGDVRETWREQVATVAAYREAQGVPDDAYRLTDPGMVDRDTRHAFADAEQAHEDLRRTGWMRDRDGAERNTAGPVPAAETTVEAVPPSTDHTAAADAPARAAGDPTTVRPGDGPADPPVATPAAEPVEKPVPDATEAIRRLANDPDALADALRRRQEAAAARDAAAQAAREAAQQAEATKRNTYDQSGPRQDQNGPQRHM